MFPVLNRNLPVPLYYQIAEVLLEQIRNGMYTAGAQLPSERDLSVQFGVSRMTARQAIMYLVNDGVLVVKHGQGTFVAEPKLTYDAPHLLGFTEAMLRAGKHATSAVLEQAKIQPTASIAQHLNLAQGEPVVKIMRVRHNEDIPLVLETTYLPASKCPDLEVFDLSATALYDVLENHYHLPLHHASQTLAAHPATDFEAELLDIEAGAPIITLEGITFLESGVPVEYFSAHYRADRFAFVFESQRGAFDPASTPFEIILDQQRLSQLG
jgi:GntR family transcriptional regulator